MDILSRWDLHQWVLNILGTLTLRECPLCPWSCADREGVQVRQEGRSRLCVLHAVAPWRVDLLRGRRLGALLLQLQDGEAAQNPDCKSARWQQISRSLPAQPLNEAADDDYYWLMFQWLTLRRCVSWLAGSRQRRHRHHTPPVRQPDRHLQRGRPPAAMETLNGPSALTWRDQAHLHVHLKPVTFFPNSRPNSLTVRTFNKWIIIMVEGPTERENTPTLVLSL